MHHHSVHGLLCALALVCAFSGRGGWALYGGTKSITTHKTLIIFLFFSGGRGVMATGELSCASKI